MPLHLIKLCVGAESISDLRQWIAERVKLYARQTHTTRMMPKRRDEILAGGSLYWVIKGEIACRQRILDLCPTTGADGIARCDIVLDPCLVCVDPRPKGSFQGWRYLEEKDAPDDLALSWADGDLPLHLRREMKVIGLL